MKMQKLLAGLLVAFLAIGLTSCASRQAVQPPQIQKQTVVKRISLPADCFDHVAVEVVQQGDTNEDLAHAYRDNLDATLQSNERADECQAMNGETVE